MPEKTIAIRVDEELFKKVKIRLAENGMTLKDYIITLIERDLQEDVKQTVEKEMPINETSIKEAQKILDFISGIMNSEKK
ncbi:MAG TPA: hypothetical protein H9765_07815 [Candidatus Mediterraneibacter intestinigallinarum]|nr:hypothetical protein [Candidatus Mediterraneibacter intestinigallinarum]